MLQGSRVGIAATNVATGDANSRAVDRNIPQHNGTCADASMITDLNIAENFSAGANHDTAANRGMALACFFTSTAEGDALINQRVVTDDGGFTNDDTHTVINKGAFAESSAGVNFNAGKEASEMGNEAWQEGNTPTVQPMGEPMGGDRVEAGVAAEHFQPMVSGRIAPEDDLKVFNEG